MPVRLSDLASLVLACLPMSALVLAAQTGPSAVVAIPGEPAAAHASGWTSSPERQDPWAMGPA